MGICVLGEKDERGKETHPTFFPPKQQLREKDLWEEPRKPNCARQLSFKWLHTLQNVFTFLMHFASRIYLVWSLLIPFSIKEDDWERLFRGHRMWTLWISEGGGLSLMSSRRCHLWGVLSWVQIIYLFNNFIGVKFLYSIVLLSAV